jgi:pimeloyl-ACP methyl ester carboxylesterase
MMLAAIGLPLGLPAAAWLFHRVAQKIDDRKHPAPGIMLNRGGRSLHVHSSGEGPVVICESGLAASSINWALVRERLPDFKICAYDRAGFGWSEAGSPHFSLQDLVEDLRSVIDSVSSDQKVMLLGHSFGAHLSRLFADLHPERVSAVVLLDPPSYREWSAPSEANAARLRRGVMLSRRGAVLAKGGWIRLSLMLVTNTLAPFARGVAKGVSGNGEQVATKMVNEIKKLPQASWGAIRKNWCQSKGFYAMARHLELLPGLSTRVAALEPRHRTAVISTRNSKPMEREEHLGLANRDNSRFFQAEISGHWPQLDQPDVVAEAVRWAASGELASSR